MKRLTHSGEQHTKTMLNPISGSVLLNSSLPFCMVQLDCTVHNSVLLYSIVKSNFYLDSIFLQATSTVLFNSINSTTRAGAIHDVLFTHASKTPLWSVCGPVCVCACVCVCLCVCESQRAEQFCGLLGNALTPASTAIYCKLASTAAKTHTHTHTHSPSAPY